MDRVNTLVFYRVEEGRVVEKGRRNLSDAERIALHQKRVQDLASDDALLGDFNRGLPYAQQADAFSIGSLIVQMTKS